MTLTYQLSEDDRLQNLLFIASKSDTVKKIFRKSRVTNSALMFILSVLFFVIHNRLLGYYFLALGIIFAAFYNPYVKWKYKRKLIKTAKKMYTGSLQCTTSFTDEFVETEGATGSTKIYLTEIEKAFETEQYFFLRFNSGSMLIIPKNQIDIEAFRNELLTILNRLKLRLIPELDWKWK